jgi:hypothetical protein
MILIGDSMMKVSLLLMLGFGNIVFMTHMAWAADSLFRKQLPGGVPFLWPTTADQGSRDAVQKEDVLRLLMGLYPQDSLKTVFGVESFRFIPLEKNKMYLVAVTDVTGRDFFNSVEVVFCERDQCQMASLSSDGENDLGEQLVDVEGDGVFEIMTREITGGYDGVATRPIYLYAIRKLVANQVTDVSSSYREYFRDHLLPKMEEDRKHVEAEVRSLGRPVALRVPDLDRNQTQTMEERAAQLEQERERERWKNRAASEIKYVQDEYRRRVLGETNAGLDNALKWARSDDPWIQKLGICALEVIADTAAQAELQRMVKSPDAGTSQRARHALENRARMGLSVLPREVK